MASIVKVDRRRFIKVSGTAGAGLVIGFALPSPLLRAAQEAQQPFTPNAWLSIDPEGQVTIWVAKSEMGQGVLTSLPMIVADELGADWGRVKIQQALADPKYGSMTTGGSASIRRSFAPLREAGAAARMMLVAAAAKAWGAEPSACRAESGEVLHVPTGRRVSYGELAPKAARMEVPKQIQLKNPKEFKLIGKPMHRLDTPEKVDGRALFGMDVEFPGLHVAAVARCPVFGGKVKRFDAAKAKALPGVVKIVEVPTGVAVVAKDTWSAFQGRDALQVEWDEGPAAKTDSAGLWAMLHEKGKEEGAIARNEGDAPAALKAAAKRLQAQYEAPFLAHATMEPMNATVRVEKGGCEIWAPTQAPQWAQGEVARLLGLAPEKVVFHTTLLGGGFGRRAMPDFVVEAAQVARAAGVSVKVAWSREDDMRHDFYRPMSLHLLEGGLDGRGKLTAYTHRLVAPSISDQMNPGSVKGVDEAAVDGAANILYAIPNLRVEYVMARTPVPLGWWRSVYASQNAFATECFIDELAAAAGRDPVEFRLELLGASSPMHSVVALAAERAGWGKPLPSGWARGAACCECFGTRVAEVAEVSVEKGQARVHRVTCAVDCGQVVNPDTVRAQVESAVVYGLSAVLTGEITIEKGRVKQGNFDDYPVLRMREMPEVEVHMLLGDWETAKLGGMGEPGLPPLAPAVANALFRVTGRRIRRLPLKGSGA